MSQSLRMRSPAGHGRVRDRAGRRRRPPPPQPFAQSRFRADRPAAAATMLRGTGRHRPEEGRGPAGRADRGVGLQPRTACKRRGSTAARTCMLAVPNVTFAKGNFTNSFNFAIRGIGTKAVGALDRRRRRRPPEQRPAAVGQPGRRRVLRRGAGRGAARPAGHAVRPQRHRRPGQHHHRQARPTPSRPRSPANWPATTAPSRCAAWSTCRSWATCWPFAWPATTSSATASAPTPSTTTRSTTASLCSTRVSVVFNPADTLRANFMWEHFKEDDSRARVGKQLCTKDLGPATIGGVPTGTARNFLTQGCPVGLAVRRQRLRHGQHLGHPDRRTGQHLVGFTSGDANLRDPTSRDLREMRPAVRADPTSPVRCLQFNADFDLTEHLTLILRPRL